jgi:hypothetical protein
MGGILMNILATMEVAKTLDYINEPIQPKLKYFMKILKSLPIVEEIKSTQDANEL